MSTPLKRTTEVNANLKPADPSMYQFIQNPATVDPAVIATAVAAGTGRFHYSNKEQLTAKELYERFQKLNEQCSKAITPPTAHRVFGEDGAKSPSGFYPGDLRDRDCVNTYMVAGKNVNVSSFASGVFNRCVEGGRVRDDRIHAFREFLSYLSSSLDVLEEQGAGTNEAIDEQRIAKLALADTLALGKVQMAWERALTDEQIAAIEAREVADEKQASTEAELAETKGALAKLQGVVSKLTGAK